MAMLDTIAEVVGELSTWAFSTALTVPDATVPAGERPPTLAEIDALELSVFLATTGAYITAWVFSAGTWAAGSEVLKNINVKNVGRGTYVPATGLLTIVLHAGDNCLAAAGSSTGATETHEALISVRYNTNVDQLHKRVQFRVENLAAVPRVP